MGAAYHPTPMVQHLDRLWNYREIEMVSAATLQGHSGPLLFRFKEEEAGVQMGYKQWPHQNALYKVLDLTLLAAAFNRDPDQVHILNDKRNRSLDCMENNLR